MCQKTVTAVTNTNQREINERRTGSTGFKLFKFRQEWNVSLIFTFVTTWCEAKSWGCSHHICGVCGSQVSEEVNPVSPAEPQLSCWAPVFCKHKQAFLVQKNAIPRLLKTCHRTIHTPYHNSSVLDSSRPAQWPVGASRPRLQTQMGVQARDDFHMSLCTCKCVLSLLFFFLSLISFFVFLLKMPHWDWEAVL